MHQELGGMRREIGGTHREIGGMHREIGQIWLKTAVLLMLQAGLIVSLIKLL